jgi:pSer/pThr/pTyr-binding forkhead associated (FHA) protein
VTQKHNDHTSDEATADITSAFRGNFSDPDAPATARAQGAGSGIDELPSGSLVVKRGPNAGSRFVLDQPVTSAGRHPNSDIFGDDITVSRRHAEFRRQNSGFQVVDVGASTAPTSTVSRCNRHSRG